MFCPVQTRLRKEEREKRERRSQPAAAASTTHGFSVKMQCQPTPASLPCFTDNHDIKAKRLALRPPQPLHGKVADAKGLAESGLERLWQLPRAWVRVTASELKCILLQASKQVVVVVVVVGRGVYLSKLVKKGDFWEPFTKGIFVWFS